MQNKLQEFDTISLDQLNATMSLMDRVESKYILAEEQLPVLLKKLEKDYFVLQIKNKKYFGYHSVYFDTKDMRFYKEHGKGLKMRTKIRSRSYVDSNLTFFEFKQKYYDTVRKFRFEQKASAHGKRNRKSSKFFHKLYKSTYGHTITDKISPTIVTEYKRFTLCSKNNDERITFDTKIRLSKYRDIVSSVRLDKVIIVETKSANKESNGRKVLSKMGMNPIEACSKYCLGVHLLYPKIKKYKRFENTLTYIRNIQEGED